MQRWADPVLIWPAMTQLKPPELRFGPGQEITRPEGWQPLFASGAVRRPPANYLRGTTFPVSTARFPAPLLVSMPICVSSLEALFSTT